MSGVVTEEAQQRASAAAAIELQDPSSFLNTLKSNQLVDCSDSSFRRWQCGEITEVEQDRVCVHYCCCDGPEDEYIDRASGRLQPFQTHRCEAYDTVECPFACIRIPTSTASREVIVIVSVDDQRARARASAHVDYTLTHNDCVIDHVIANGGQLYLTRSEEEGVDAVLAADWRLTVQQETAESEKARAAARQEHIAKEAHCEKLLVDLPKALEQSKADLILRLRPVSDCMRFPLRSWAEELNMAPVS